jgi:hypothetical protein
MIMWHRAARQQQTHTSSRFHGGIWRKGSDSDGTEHNREIINDELQPSNYKLAAAAVSIEFKEPRATWRRPRTYSTCMKYGLAVDKTAASSSLRLFKNSAAFERVISMCASHSQAIKHTHGSEVNLYLCLEVLCQLWVCLYVWGRKRQL